MSARGSLIRTMREWGTPLTIGAFVIMATTGGLMFFHRAMALNGLLHRWAGLAMIGAVVIHAFVNWPSIERYVTRSALARGIMGLSAVLLVGSFVNWWGYQGKVEGAVYRAVMSAPLANVAALVGEPMDALKADLAEAGLRDVSSDETLREATRDDRDLQAKVVSSLFRRNGEAPR